MFSTGARSADAAIGTAGATCSGGAAGAGAGAGGGTNFTVPPQAGQSVTRPAFSFEYQHRNTFPQVGHLIVKSMNPLYIGKTQHRQALSSAIATSDILNFNIVSTLCFILFSSDMRGKSSRRETITTDR
jgi:hypothetical protein